MRLAEIDPALALGVLLTVVGGIIALALCLLVAAAGRRWRQRRWAQLEADARRQCIATLAGVGDLELTVAHLMALRPRRRGAVLVDAADGAGADASQAGPTAERLHELTVRCGLTSWVDGRRRHSWEDRLLAIRVAALAGRVDRGLAAVTDNHPRVRAVATASLGAARAGTPERELAQTYVLQALADEDGVVRAAARSVLHGWEREGAQLCCGAVRAHLDGAGTDGDQGRRAAHEALVVLGDLPVSRQEQVQVLFDASHALDPATRRLAVAALAASGVTSRNHDDPCAKVRRAWAQSAARTRDRNHLPRLVLALIDADPSVRRAAGDAILAHGRLGELALQHAPAGVARSAAALLERVGVTPDAPEVLA